MNTIEVAIGSFRNNNTLIIPHKGVCENVVYFDFISGELTEEGFPTAIIYWKLDIFLN